MKRRRWLETCCKAAGLGLVAPQLFAQTEPVHLSRFPQSANQFVAAQILTEIYRRCGLTARIEPMPPPRAPLELLAGRLDGEVSRLKSHLDDFPTLVRVTPAFDYFTMSAFSDQRIAISSKYDLRKYRVGVIRGVQAAADLVVGLDNVERASNSETLFLMLAAGRFDVAIDVGINGAFQIAKHRLTAIHPVGDLSRAEVYHYLAPHKAHLQPCLAAKTTEMRRTGELGRLKEKLNRAFVVQGIEPD